MRGSSVAGQRVKRRREESHMLGTRSHGPVLPSERHDYHCRRRRLLVLAESIEDCGRVRSRIRRRSRHHSSRWADSCGKTICASAHTSAAHTNSDVAHQGAPARVAPRAESPKLGTLRLGRVRRAAGLVIMQPPDPGDARRRSTQGPQSRNARPSSIPSAGGGACGPRLHGN